MLERRRGFGGGLVVLTESGFGDQKDIAGGVAADHFAAEHDAPAGVVMDRQRVIDDQLARVAGAFEALEVVDVSLVGNRAGQLQRLAADGLELIQRRESTLSCPTLTENSSSEILRA